MSYTVSSPAYGCKWANDSKFCLFVLFISHRSFAIWSIVERAACESNARVFPSSRCPFVSCTSGGTGAARIAYHWQIMILKYMSFYAPYDQEPCVLTRLKCWSASSFAKMSKAKAVNSWTFRKWDGQEALSQIWRFLREQKERRTLSRLICSTLSAH